VVDVVSAEDIGKLPDKNVASGGSDPSEGILIPQGQALTIAARDTLTSYKKFSQWLNVPSLQFSFDSQMPATVGASSLHCCVFVPSIKALDTPEGWRPARRDSLKMFRRLR
jgi:hypothetical protein